MSCERSEDLLRGRGCATCQSGYPRLQRDTRQMCVSGVAGGPARPDRGSAGLIVQGAVGPKADVRSGVERAEHRQMPRRRRAKRFSASRNCGPNRCAIDQAPAGGEQRSLVCCCRLAAMIARVSPAMPGRSQTSHCHRAEGYPLLSEGAVSRVKPAGHPRRCSWARHRTGLGTRGAWDLRS